MNSMEEEASSSLSSESPLLFRCPISMELMEDPVTVSTGVTYERRNIEKWLHAYNKTTCPATMQTLTTLHLTPNNTLKSLILSSQQHQPPSVADHDNLINILTTIRSTPFKVTSLKNLCSALHSAPSLHHHFLRSGGVQLLASIISDAPSDFSAFRACEESLAILRYLPLTDPPSAEALTKPDCMNAMTLVLQRGSADARLHAMTILGRLSNKEWMVNVNQEITTDAIRSLLELLSDEVSAKLSAASLDVLTEITSASRRNRQRAVESGAVCVLVELLPEAGRQKCERILLLLKRLCEVPEGRSALGDHGMGVAAVSKKVLRVSDVVTKLGVKILWLVCSLSPREKVVEEMMVYGAVRKLFGLLQLDGRSTTKEKVVRMLKMHGGAWRQYGCFPCELKEYLKLLHYSR